MVNAYVVKLSCFIAITLSILMNSSIWFDIMNLGYLIVHIKGSQVKLFKFRYTSVAADCVYLSKHCRP